MDAASSWPQKVKGLGNIKANFLLLMENSVPVRTYN